MEEAVAFNTPTGSLLRLSGRVRLDGLWLGPAAAALAGALASGSLRWNGHLLLLVILADLGWGNIWWAVAGTDWSTMRDRWNAWVSPETGSGTAVLPYMQPASPAGRLVRWWADLRAWSRVELWPERAAQLGAILIGLPVALTLSAALGTEMVLMTLGVMAISQMALFLGRANGSPSPLAQAIVEIGVPWLSGSLMFGRLDGAILAAAIGLALAYVGLVLLGRGKQGGIWLALGQMILVIVLLTMRHSLGAAAVGIFVLPQLALLPWHTAGLGDLATVRLAQWPMLAAMFVAALAL